MGLYFTLGILFGGICAALASSKDRSVVGWFAIGFFLPIIGLILILVLDEPTSSGGLKIPVDLEAFPPPRAAALSDVEKLERLAALHQQGSLTDSEFSEQKARVLARNA